MEQLHISSAIGASDLCCILSVCQVKCPLDRACASSPLVFHISTRHASHIKCKRVFSTPHRLDGDDDDEQRWRRRERQTVVDEQPPSPSCRCCQSCPSSTPPSYRLERGHGEQQRRKQQQAPPQAPAASTPIHHHHTCIPDIVCLVFHMLVAALLELVFVLL